MEQTFEGATEALDRLSKYLNFWEDNGVPFHLDSYKTELDRVKRFVDRAGLLDAVFDSVSPREEYSGYELGMSGHIETGYYGVVCPVCRGANWSERNTEPKHNEGCPYKAVLDYDEASA